jgi:hypothetical protein
MQIALSYSPVKKHRREKVQGGDFPRFSEVTVYHGRQDKRPEIASALENLGLHVMHPTIHQSVIRILNPPAKLPRKVELEAS